MRPGVSSAAVIDPQGVLGFKWGDSIGIVKEKSKKQNLTVISEKEESGYKTIMTSISFNQSKVFGIDNVQVRCFFTRLMKDKNDKAKLFEVSFEFPPNSYKKIKDFLKSEYGYIRKNGLPPDEFDYYTVGNSGKYFHDTFITSTEKHPYADECYLSFKALLMNPELYDDN
jgi:hypothetical protein